MKTTLVELSYKNAIKTNGVSEWTNTIKQTIIKSGDTINVKMCFIDSGADSNADILINDDVTINFIEQTADD